MSNERLRTTREIQEIKERWGELKSAIENISEDTYLQVVFTVNSEYFRIPILPAQVTAIFAEEYEKLTAILRHHKVKLDD